MSSNNASQGGGGIYSHAGSVTSSDSTLSSNTARDGTGGGVFSYSGTVTINNSTLSDNFTNQGGGGIYSHANSVTISNSTLSGNSASGNGGAIQLQDTTLDLKTSEVSNNAADYGGGLMVNEKATTKISYSTVSGNSATQTGGGAYARHGESSTDGGHLYIYYSTFSENTAAKGGAINAGGKAIVTVKNCTLSGNSAKYNGGGLRAHGGQSLYAHASVYFSTLAGNHAGTGGGGIYIESYANLTLKETIVSGNGAASGAANIHSVTDRTNVYLNYYNLFGYNKDSGVGGSAKVGDTDYVPTAINIDTILGPLADNGGPNYTHALVSGSPAIGFAAASSCPTQHLALDQRGYGRPASGYSKCSIGSYEYGATDATAATIQSSGQIKRLGTDKGELELKGAFAIEHELDLSDAVVRIEQLAAEGPARKELIAFEGPVEVTARSTPPFRDHLHRNPWSSRSRRPGSEGASERFAVPARAGKATARRATFVLNDPDLGKGKLELKVKGDVLTAKLDLKQLQIAEPTGCAEDGQTPVASRFIVRTGENPPVVIAPDALWDWEFRRDGTVQALER